MTHHRNEDLGVPRMITALLHTDDENVEVTSDTWSVEIAQRG
jgi:hypothetical protein